MASRPVEEFLGIDSICESPRFSSPDDFGLNDAKMNEMKAKILLADPNCRKIKDNLYSVEPTEDGENVLFEVKKLSTMTQIVYYVSFQLEKLSLLPRESITQVALWKSLLSSNDASDRFWKYIFPKTGLAVSDRVQTEKGRKFWLYLVDQASKRGVYPYLLDFRRKRIIDLDEGVDSFFKLSNTAYSDYAETEQFRWCLSKDKLTKSVPASKIAKLS